MTIGPQIHSQQLNPRTFILDWLRDTTPTLSAASESGPLKLAVATPPKRSRALAELDANSMSEPAYPEPSSKRRKMSQSSSSTQSDDVSLLKDLEITPRAARTLSHDSMLPASYSLPPPSPATGRSEMRRGSPSKESNASSTRSKPSAKNISDTALRPKPIISKSFEKLEGSLPSGLKQMVSTFKKIGRGFGVISEDQKVCG
jgi:hypothetical protein